MIYVLMIAVIICIFMSLRTLFFPSKLKHKLVSFDNFLFLGSTYSVIMIGFGLLFMLLEIKGFNVIAEQGSHFSGNYIEKLNSSMYLSAITLFSVGYGDIVPIGIGRILVVLEALIGYTIPAAFVVKSVIDYEQNNEMKK
ncbi:potassium channel family protein [Heyndrickxia sp. FSL W8-0423]|uniref:potassium channel family protein n=1 Tax=Heyndrickxia sp. FSL W8-0423 TaxID=2921601 RepID=UPI0030F9192F